MEKKYGFHFEYKIKISPNEEFSYDEYFEPYKKEVLLSSPLFKLFGNKYKSLFKNDANINYEKENDFLCDITEKKILPDTIHILMDAVYCTYIASLNFETGNKLMYSGNDIFLSVDNNDINILKFIFDSREKYIGIYTEIIKSEVDKIKFILSVLIRLYNTIENINKNFLNDFLNKFKNVFLEDSSNFILEIPNEHSIKNILLTFCNSLNFQRKSKEFVLEIDFRKFDKFISLLNKHKNYSGKADFINGRNCFCLIHEGKDYYFSLSGYSDNYEEMGYKIQKDFKIYFPNNSLHFCKRNSDMLSYGYLNKNRKFVKFKHPQKEEEQKDLFSQKDMSLQYSCCERKIFAYTDKKIDNLKNMYIYCKYKSCKLCVPAIRKQKNKYCDFKFYAFVKNRKSLNRHIKKKMNILLRQTYFYINELL